MNRLPLRILLFLAAIPLTAGFLVQHTPPGHSAWQPAPADTVLAGRVYITVLPDSIGGDAVESYDARELPLLSWLRGNGFFWRTRPDDRGEHRFVFTAQLESGASDSLMIDVVVN